MTSPDSTWDIVICGGGLAGLTIARQLRRDLPSLRIAIVEKTKRPLPEACHKVGESSVELGTAYLQRLGLGEYLEREHVIKFGLRFFPGGGHLPLEQRAEIGPWQEPVLRSFQLDRGKFENDLRAMNEQDGVTLFEGTMVRDIDLGKGDELHRLTLESGDAVTPITARWVIDATGRNALVKRRLKMSRGTRHVANAGWFRVEGKVTLQEIVETPDGPWHDVLEGNSRWRSTNHLMGEGYWAWIIVLGTNKTSIGIVTHDEVHGFEKVHTHAKCMEFLREHEPKLAARLEDAEPLDFRCLKNYSHNVARSWSPDRWAIVGEAGAFTDPLYSPGTDFIALANSFTVEVIRADEAGEDIDPLVRRLNAEYRALVSGTCGIYKLAAPVYDHARAFAAKLYWDNFLYWSYTCQYFLQGIFKHAGEVADGARTAGMRFVQLSDYVQALVAAWARRHPEEPNAGFVPLPAFPSLLVDAHLDMQKELSPEETLALMQRRLSEGEQMVSEYVVRLLLELGPDAGPALLEDVGFAKWHVAVDRRRLDAEGLAEPARTKALPMVARDVERNLGPVKRHERWADALEHLTGGPTRAESVAR